MSKAFLLLADNTVYEGKAFGAVGTRVGEIVFNTAMSGYEETLTEPSYFGQIITQTYPIIGSSGINGEDAESDKIWAFGYIVRECCDYASNFRNKQSLSDFLKQSNVIGIEGLDTRSLTRKLRDKGVMNGALTTEYESAEQLLADKTLTDKILSYKIEKAVESVTTKSITTANNNNKYHVAVLDFGFKRHILTILEKYNCRVRIVPATTSPQQLKELNIDGIILSDGPGNPAENAQLIENIKEIAKMGKPIFGICLGHQLMALAMGGKTAKLKYGHRGANQPVTDFAKNRTFITSQNHGYTVLADSINQSIAQISHVNANDKTVEGLRYNGIPCFTVQFYPTAHGGPNDTEYLFSEFIGLMEGHANA